MSIFYWPVKVFGIESIFLQNLIYKIPLLLADLSIYLILIGLFRNKTKLITLFYWMMPIIFYASFMHAQLDLIPTALFLGSILTIKRKKTLWASILFGLAISTKLHLLAAFPILVLYVQKRQSTKSAMTFFVGTVLTYVFFVFPYLSSPGFINLVLLNPKQSLLLQNFIQINHLKIYLPILAVTLLYLKFSIHKKVNFDLLVAYLGILFSVFLLLVQPSPGWYIWLCPFLSIFFVKCVEKQPKTAYIYATFNVAYLAFFLLAAPSDFSDLNYLGVSVNMKSNLLTVRFFLFTILETILIYIVYLLYIFGLKSNSVYHKDGSLLLAIGGDSASGKSILLGDLGSIFNNKLLALEGDGAHKWERGDKNWKKFTHLNPKANDLHEQASHLIQLKSGKSVKMKSYDHNSGKFTKPKVIKSKEYIVLSGLHPFYLPMMRKLTNIKIFMDTEEKLRKKWKLIRDSTQRNQKKEVVKHEINRRQLDQKKYINSQKQFADLTVSYYLQKNGKLGESLGLKITIDANLHLEKVVDVIRSNGIPVEWDYELDLKNQFLHFKQPISKEILDEIAKNHIENLDEIIEDEIQWEPGYRSIVQLMVLFLTSAKLREL